MKVFTCDSCLNSEVLQWCSSSPSCTVCIQGPFQVYFSPLISDLIKNTFHFKLSARSEKAGFAINRIRDSTQKKRIICFSTLNRAKKKHVSSYMVFWSDFLGLCIGHLCIYHSSNTPWGFSKPTAQCSFILQTHTIIQQYTPTSSRYDFSNPFNFCNLSLDLSLLCVSFKDPYTTINCINTSISTCTTRILF